MNRTTTLIVAGLLVAGTLTGCASAAPVAVRAPVTVTATRTAPAVTATATETATETETPPEVTRTVPQAFTPPACAAAMDDAEAIITSENNANKSFVDAIQLLGDEAVASATVKVNEGSAEITKATERLKQYTAHRSTCLGLSS